MAADGSIDTRAISCCADRISPIDWSCHGYTATTVIPQIAPRRSLGSNLTQSGAVRRYECVVLERTSRFPFPSNFFPRSFPASTVQTSSLCHDNLHNKNVIWGGGGESSVLAIAVYSFNFVKYCDIHFILVNFIVRFQSQGLFTEKRNSRRNMWFAHRLFRSRIRFSVP